MLTTCQILLSAFYSVELLTIALLNHHNTHMLKVLYSPDSWGNPTQNYQKTRAIGIWIHSTTRHCFSLMPRKEFLPTKTGARVSRCSEVSINSEQNDALLLRRCQEQLFDRRVKGGLASSKFSGSERGPSKCYCLYGTNIFCLRS